MQLMVIARGLLNDLSKCVFGLLSIKHWTVKLRESFYVHVLYPPPPLPPKIKKCLHTPKRQ